MAVGDGHKIHNVTIYDHTAYIGHLRRQERESVEPGLGDPVHLRCQILKDYGEKCSKPSSLEVK
jgi:hypothetical protein